MDHDSGEGRRRRSRLHALDESQILSLSDALESLSQEHYCVAFGVKDEQGILQNFGFRRFAAAPPPRFPVGI